MQNILMQSFLHTRGRTLRILYAWFHHLSFQNLWQSRLRYALGQADSIEMIMEKVEQSTDAYKEIPDSTLQLQFLLELADFLGIEVYQLQTEEDVQELFFVLIEQVNELMMESDESYKGKNVTDIMQYQLKKRCEWVDDWYETLEKNAKEYFLAVLKRFLVELSNQSDKEEYKKWRHLMLSDINHIMKENGSYPLFHDAIQTDDDFTLMKKIMNFLNEFSYKEITESETMEPTNRPFLIEIEFAAFPHWLKMNKEVIVHGEKQALRELLLPVFISEIVLLGAPMIEKLGTQQLLDAYSEVQHNLEKLSEQINELEKESANLLEEKEHVYQQISHLIDEFKEIDQQQDVRIKQLYRAIQENNIPLQANDLLLTSLLTKRKLLLEDLENPMNPGVERKGLGKLFLPIEKLNYKRKMQQDIDQVEEKIILHLIEHEPSGICGKKIGQYHQSVLKQKEINEQIEQKKEQMADLEEQMQAIKVKIEQIQEHKKTIEQQFYIQSEALKKKEYE
ncbi:coiled-coil domain-containing protein [Massilibacterium senegalense]|uniref:hypothetical protein n=1 Tax=Massilibacterium senegalense TaxID=1632858 RepID=UPI0007852F30|nr:hypothetical protein [Massilibacterium senegalense]